MTLTVCAWKWKRPDGSELFPAFYVNRMRAAIARHLQLDHEFVCVTDDPTGIDGDVRIVPLPPEYRDTPRCRRRMRHFDREFAHTIGDRILAIDLDMVIVGDLTPLVNRPEPLVCYYVRHAQVFSGSCLLMDAGVLHPLWELFRADPEGLPVRAWPRGIGSDQAMLNWYFKQQQIRPPCWTERDGFVTFYGAGYERFEHLGIGLTRSTLPPGARVVVLGSDDLYVLEQGRFPWCREHWGPATAIGATA